MTSPLPPMRPLPGPPTGPTTWPITAITVADPGCGHLPGEPHDQACDYWRGVLTGEYPHPDTYMVTGEALGLPPHADVPCLTDPALTVARAYMGGPR